MTNPIDILCHAESLYDQGKFVSAYAACAPLGDLGKWTGSRGRILAGRLAYQLGRSSWSTALHQLALREHPLEPKAIYYGTLALRSRRGHLRTWLEVRDRDLPESASVEERADWLALKGSLLTSLRDFQQAQKWIDLSLTLFPESPWNHLVQATFFRMRDQHEAALDCCRRSLVFRSSYRPALQTYAELLTEGNRSEEAYTLLADAQCSMESPAITAQLAYLCLELQKFDEALDLLDRYKRLAVLAVPKHVDVWVRMMRARCLYLAGRFEETISVARLTESDYWARFAGSLEQVLLKQVNPRTCRAILSVPFIRQHRLTCAPATLAALSEYWEKPIRHEEIAARICYDGTLSHDERSWANDNGFLAKEFCVNSKVAHELINAGIPFALTTTGVSSGHLQAVVGYDSIGEVLVIRDPSSHTLVEATTEKLLEYYASSGPRGMLIVPVEQSEKLKSIELPESELYDLQYAIDIALSRYERNRAVELIANMKQVAPDHRLTLQSEFSLHRHDGHHYECLSIVKKLLEKYPKDLRLVLCQFEYIRDIGTRNERIEFLQKAVDDFGENPLLMAKLAEEYLMDAREHRKAERDLRALTRWVPHDANAVALYARLSWEQQRYEDAIEISRIAACLEDKDESYSRTYFSIASRHRRTDIALEWLKYRHELLGKRNSDPTLSYIWALEETQQIPSALTALRDALSWNHDDGDLLCSASVFFERYGMQEESRSCLDQADGRTTETKLVRTKAIVARSRGLLEQAREYYERLIQLAPTDWNSLDTLLDLDLQLNDEMYAEKRLRTYIEAWPQCAPLQERIVSWLRRFNPDALPAELDRALQNDPNNTWLIREAAISALEQGNYEIATKQVELCRELEPNYYLNWNLQAQIHSKIGDRLEVRKSIMRALQLCIDNPWGMQVLISTCRADEEYEKDFRFLFEQLRVQATLGEGILAYRKYGSATRDSKRMLEDLLEAHRVRPDLWQAWSALIQQYIFMGLCEDAFVCAKGFTDRFPFSVQSWLDYANVCKLCVKPDLQLQALQRSSELNPTSAEVARQLADLYYERDQVAEAIDVLQKAISCNPRDGVLYGYLADIFWSENQEAEALRAIQKAVTLYPDYEWAWNCLGYWCQQTDRQKDAIELAESLLRSERTSAQGYLRLTELHLLWKRHAEAVKTAEAGIKVKPRHLGLRLLYVQALESMGEVETALAACQVPEFQANIPAELLFMEGDLLVRLDRKEESLKKRKLGLEIAPFSRQEWHKFLEVSQYYAPIEEHVVDCQKFVSLAPADAMAHYYLASALKKWKPEERIFECIAEYEAAVKFDPNHASSAYDLFFLYLKVDRQFDARKLVYSFPDSIDPSHHDTLRLFCDCLEDEATTFNRIRHYSQCDLKISYHSLRCALDICEPVSWISAMEDVWQTASNCGWLGIVWGEAIMRKEPPEKIIQKLSTFPVGDAWYSAWKTLLQYRSGKRFPLPLIREATEKFKNELSLRSITWDVVGTYFLNREDHVQAYRWCGNWRDVKIDDPEHLIACITAHWRTRHYKVAHRLVKKGQALRPESIVPVIELWHVVEQVRRGNSAGAINKLEYLYRRFMDLWYGDLLKVTEYVAKKLELIERSTTIREKREILHSLNVSDLESYALISKEWKEWYLVIVCQSVTYNCGMWWDFSRYTVCRLWHSLRPLKMILFANKQQRIQK